MPLLGNNHWELEKPPPAITHPTLGKDVEYFAMRFTGEMFLKYSYVLYIPFPLTLSYMRAMQSADYRLYLASYK